MIDDLKESGAKSISLTDSNEKSTINSKRDSSIVMISNDIDKIIEEPFDSLLHRYQIGLE